MMMTTTTTDTPTSISKRRRGEDRSTEAVFQDTVANNNPTNQNSNNNGIIQPYIHNNNNNNINNVKASVSLSTLPCPTLQLTGHSGSIYALKYSPIYGSTLCSTSFDMTCLLWQHRPIEYDDIDNIDDDDENELNNNITNHNLTTSNNVATYHNFHTLRGHKNAVLDCTWFDVRTIVTASADQTLMLWDIVSEQRLRKYSNHHTGIVNAVTTINEYQFVSVSDDTSILLWDRRSKYPTGTYRTNYPVLAVAASSTSQQQKGSTVSEYQIYTAGIDPIIRIWDTRRMNDSSSSHRNNSHNKKKLEQDQQLDELLLNGHTDTVTCLSIHPDGTHLLSNSMDQSLIQWDIRPFVGTITTTGGIQQQQRHVRTFRGHQHNADKGLLKCSWSADGSFVTCGSSDARVHIYDVHTGQEIYDLPGHKGCVNTVTFHPTESTVIASGSSDKHIFVGELS